MRLQVFTVVAMAARVVFAQPQFADRAFSAKLDSAMKRAKTLLEDSIRPVRLDQAPHQYDDKFAAATVATRLALDSVWAVLASAFPSVRPSSTLRFAATETVSFRGERERRVAPTVTVTEDGRKKSKVEATVTEFLWTREVTFSAALVDGVNRSDVEGLLFERAASRQEVTLDRHVEPPPATCATAYLDLRALAALPRAVDRAAPTCRTPRRNDQVDAVLKFFADDLTAFLSSVRASLGAYVAPDGARVSQVFSPSALPVVFSPPAENNETIGHTEEALVAELRRTLAEQRPEDDASALLLSVEVLRQTIDDYAAAVNYLEALLRAQLESAVGKELTAEAFDEYAVSHDRQLFRAPFRPAWFSYAVRRSRDAFPDGTVSFVDAGLAPLRTFVADATAATAPFRFAIGAATHVTFDGPRYAHAYVSRTFGGLSPKAPQLHAKARPFSVFVLLLGKIASRDEFVAEHAVVVRASDEVTIPLLLTPLPTPKEFADAVESLSPEQRAFCEAFRQMQLASSLFGVVVVQVKPAIEKVLNLPRDALLKEIALTEHLAELFVDYQIPTDVLSYDGPPDALKHAKIEAVKAHVAAIRSVIQAARDEDLQKAKEHAQHRHFVDDTDEVEVEFAEAPSRQRRHRHKVAATLAYTSRRLAAFEGEDAVIEKAYEMAASSSLGGGRRAGLRGNHHDEEAPPLLEEEEAPSSSSSDGVSSGSYLDLTTMPKKLDANFKALDTDSQLRPTTIKAKDLWTRSRKQSIIADPATAALGPADLAKERRKAFDLLDALSRSGALTLSDAELHVILCATHAFDKSITDTVVEDNVNPILKAERASLIIATTLHDKPAIDLVEPRKLPSLTKSSPFLLPAETTDAGDDKAKTPPPQEEEASV